jgi:spore coat protein U-like protein
MSNVNEKRALTLFGGEIVRKCPLEHFTPQQFLFGSPYNYIVEYSDSNGGSPATRYGLWKFDKKTLDYSLFKTVGEQEFDLLQDIVNQWEKALWAEQLS